VWKGSELREAMTRKSKKGEKNVRRYLTKSEKLAILELRVEEKWARSKIAKKYDRSVRTIDRVLTQSLKRGSLARQMKISEEEKKTIMAMVRDNASVTASAISRNPDLQRVSVHTIISYLRKKGYERTGARKKPMWQREGKQ
jgi:transposase-like protein